MPWVTLEFIGGGDRNCPISQGKWGAASKTGAHPGQIWLKRAFGEKDGKDAIVVGETADLELPVPHVIRSTFGLPGSLMVYYGHSLKNRLHDYDYCANLTLRWFCRRL